MPAPTLTSLVPSLSFQENAVNATPQLLDIDVAFTDPDEDFDGGVLTLSGLLAEDRVSVRNQGAGTGQIGLSGSDVTWGGTVIGTLAGGVGGTLTITFNAAATSAAIEALIENLTYANVSNTPTASRTLRLNVTDAAGESMGGATNFTPAAGAADPFQGSDFGEKVTPALVDLDGDGDLDLVVGGQYGDLRSFRNDSGAFTELFGNDNPFDGFRVGNSYGSYSAPTFVDLDGDGDLDLVTGERYGRLEVWRNGTIGTSGAFTPLTGGDNPFDGVDVGYLSKPAFADLDGDGDLDLVVSNAYGELSTFRRDGDAFTQLSGLANPFHAVSGSNRAAPTFVDLDGDGDQDLVLGQPDGTLRVFGNANGVFTELAGPNNPFDGLSFGTYVAPTFGDLDGDGDLDLVVANQYGNLTTVFNTTAPAPGITVTVTAQSDAPASTGLPTDFTVTEDVRTVLNDQLSAFSITDLDTSGNITLTLTAGAGVVHVFDGVGSVGISGSGTGTVVLTGTAANLGAILRDGSLSVSYTGSADLSGNDATTITFTADDGSGPVTLGTVNVDITAVNDPVELAGLATSVTFGENTVNASPQLLDIDVTLTDVDDDFTGGALTLSGLLAEDRVSVRNEGSGAGQIGLSGTDVTFGGVTIGALTGGVGNTLRITFNAAATSTAVDALIQNLTYANTSNTPTATRDLVLGVTDAGGASLGAAPAFELQTGGANPLQGLDVGGGSSPTFVDLDGDGDQDLVVGESGGTLRVYRNGADGAAGAFSELTGADNPFNGIGVGIESSPAFVDLDGDGDLDLVVGHRYGGLRVWRNGTDGAAGAFTERTGANNPFNGIDVGYVSSPTFADLDGDGDQDLVVGADDGTFRTYRNGTNGSSGAFNIQPGTLNPFNGIFAGTRASGSLFDIDDDGDLDLIAGSQSGLLRVWRNNGANGAIGNLTELVGAANPLNGIDAGDRSEIAFGDLDGDGDIDAVFGGFNGLLSTLLNTATVGPTITVNVTAETDAPTATGLPTDVTVTEDAASNLNLSAITLAADVVGDITVVLTASAGTMTASSGAGVVVTNSGTGAITLTGTATAIDAFLNSASAVQYTGALNAYGDNAATVTVSADDGTGSVTLGVVNVDITAVNDAMSLTGFGPSATFDENTVNAAPQLLDVDVSFSDPDSFTGGALTITGVSADDRYSVRNEGTGAGQIGLSGTDVTYGGVVIGTLAGGVGASLTITFNAATTGVAIDALIQNLTYANVSDTPNANTSFTLNITDASGDGLVGDLRFGQTINASNPLRNADVGSRSSPTFVDLDGDGDVDAVVGTLDGTLIYYENTGTATSPVFTERLFEDNPFDPILVGSDSAPTFADLDGDGDQDLVIGRLSTSLTYFENTGTASVPAFTQRTGAANPFNGFNLGSDNTPVLGDLDGDGDLDVVVGRYAGGLQYLENTGTVGAPVFVQRTGAASPFSAIATGYYSAPSLVDADGDGDLDVVVASNDGVFRYFENTGGSSSPAFTERTGAANPFDGIGVGVGAPAFTDLDGDGDIDAAVGDFSGQIRYLRNSTPVGQIFNIFINSQNDAPTADGLPTDVTVTEDVASDLNLSAATIADGDSGNNPITVTLSASDGTLAASPGGGVTVSGSGGGTLILTGTASAIDTFLNTASNIQYTGAQDVSGDDAATVTVTANDGSGAVTLGVVNIDITGVNDPMSLTGFEPSATFAENPVNAAAELLDADVTFVGVDSDFNGGSLTLSGLLAEDRVSVRNVGTASGEVGLSGADITFGGVVIGTLAGGVGGTMTITFNAAATAEAIDALIENLTYANVSNTPTAARNLVLNVTDAAGDALGTPPAFVARTGGDNPFNGIDVGVVSTPALVDLDGDGDMDAVFGELNGALLYFENTGTASAPVFTARTGAANPFDGVDVGARSAISLADLDGDGDVDALVGEEDGFLNYLENTGTAAAPVFTQRTGAANPFDGFDVGVMSTPALVDLDGDGDLDAVVGEDNGALLYFENTGTTAAAAFTQRSGAANPFSGVDVGFQSAVAFTDLDGDGDLDAMVGENDGTLRYFENTGTGLAPAFTQRTGAANPFNGVDVGNFSNLAFADVDGDGDMDAVVGEQPGTLRYFENTTVLSPRITVHVTAGADTFTGAGVGETLTGATAGDVVSGLGGDDLLIGGAGVQTLNGGDDNDTLRGAGGNDALNGGAGSDTADYSTAAAGVAVRLGSNVTLSDGDGGLDTLNSIENATGSAFADTLFGNGFNNVLSGGLGADILLGLGGNDTLIGGAGAANTLQGGLGDDIYVVSATDTVTEFSGEGADTVQTDRAAYTLGNHVENLSYTGAGLFVGSGNSLANILTGGAARDVLSGEGGDDTLVGRGGQDALIGGLGVDTADYSAAAAGVSVRLAVNATLNDGDGSTDTLSGIENVVGSAFNDVIFGDALGNVLSGGLGADTLLGLDGADTLIGGAGAANTLQGGLGDDIYVVTANDTITELSGQGMDTVQTDRAFHTLGAHIENLTFTGSGDFQGTGNALANVITGGLGSDTLIGGQGNDTLVGGGGVDYVVLSGALADYTVLDLGGGSYEITDTVGGRDGTDIVTGVERVRFATGPTVAIASLAITPAPSQPVDKQASDPQILPGLTDDDFLMAKDGDAPLVLPGEDGIDDVSLEVAPMLPLRSGHMLTVGEGGAPVEGTEVFGGRHDHDGWLF